MYGNPVLYAAKESSEKQIEYFKFLLGKNEGLKSLSQKDEFGRTPLHILILGERIESIQLVLDKQPERLFDRLFDLNKSNLFPLFYVMKSTNNQLIKAVLQHPSIIPLIST